MDLQDKISLGAAMFATPAIDRGATTMLAEVVADATDGEVTVNLPDEEGTVQQVTVPCNGDIREGDMATLIVEDGRITAISASGEGERSKAETEAAQGAADAAQSTADTAQADATQAKTDAADAKETAAGAETAAGEAKDAADTAKSAADAAKDAADTAQSAADAAGTAASEASGKADAAQSTADAASGKADAAQSTADTASGKADAAQSAADAAQTSADAAKDAADAAQADATQAKTDAASASTAAASAQALAEEANATATATGQHFFADDSGVHVTTDEGKAAGTHNLLANSEGVFIREGENPLTGMTASGFSIYDGTGEVESACASFGARAAALNYGALELTSETVQDTESTEFKSELVIDIPTRDQTQTTYNHSFFYIRPAGYSAKYLAAFVSKDDAGSVSTINTKLGASGPGASGAPQTNTSVAGGYISVGDDTCESLAIMALKINFKTQGGRNLYVENEDIRLLAYPVGSIYMSVNSTSPARLFGGTWEEIAGGRVLMGQNSTYTAGSTGGAATHTHTGPSHTHAYGLRTSSYYGLMGMTNANGTTFDLWNGSKWVQGSSTEGTISAKMNTGINAASATKTVASPYCKTVTGSSGTGNTGSASSLPPYLSVYMWKRTA